MSWKYTLGSFADRLSDTSMRLLRPLEPIFPHGRRWPLDMRRWYTLHRRPVKTIFDVGANIGQTSLYLRRWFPSATIYGFEPVKATFEKYTANTKFFPNVRGYNFAFGQEAAQKEIPLMANSELNTLTSAAKLPYEKTGEHQQVKIVKLDDFCAENKIETLDLLKLDVQGFELEVLKGATKMFPKIHFIYAEVDFQGDNSDMTDFSRLHSFLKDPHILNTGGFEFV